MDARIERMIVDAFVQKHRRERSLFELAHREKRDDFLWKMDRHMIKNHMHRIEQPITDPRQIYEILKAHGAPETCYVMMLSDVYDGVTMGLREALEKVAFDWPLLVSCIHGELAYLEAEPNPPRNRGNVHTTRRYILQRAHGNG